jgi:hypothetical protein
MSQILNVRAFNDKGAQRFSELIQQKPENICLRAIELVSDKSLSDSLEFNFEVKFIEKRIQMAEHLWKSFGIGTEGFKHLSNRRMWNWISAAFLPYLLKNSTDQSIIAKAVGRGESRWIRSDNVFRHHRHLISGPFFVYLGNFPNVENAMAALATPVLAPGEVVERITGKDSMSHGTAMALATELYYDKKIGGLKKGAGSHAPGSPRRLSY